MQRMCTSLQRWLEIALAEEVGLFHIHFHDRFGIPGPSTVDWTEWAKFIPDFWHVRPKLPHGALILSRDRINGWCWYPGMPKPVQIAHFSVVDSRLTIWDLRK